MGEVVVKVSKLRGQETTRSASTPRSPLHLGHLSIMATVTIGVTKSVLSTQAPESLQVLSPRVLRG